MKFLGKLFTAIFVLLIGFIVVFFGTDPMTFIVGVMLLGAGGVFAFIAIDSLIHPDKRDELEMVDNTGISEDDRYNDNDDDDDYDDDYDDECDFSIGNRYYTKPEYEFWTGAIEYIAKFANDGDYISVGELMLNILNDKDNVKYAYELYTLIDHAIYYLYPMRDIGNCKDVIIDLGFRGISLMDDYIQQAKGYLTWRFPTKIAILLEKGGRIDEAIELCDFLTSRGVRDTGYNSFEARKSKLEQRQERIIQKYQDINTK